MADNKLVYEQFPTVNEFMRTVLSRPQNHMAGDDNAGKECDDDFAGGLNWEQALDALEKGLPDVCDRLKADLSKFKATGAMDIGSRTQPRNHYYGSKPNVAAAIQGRPKSMRQRQREPIKVKTVRVIYDCCANCDTKASTLQKSGVAVLCLVYALEKAGYRVQFDLLPMAVERDGAWAIAAVNLKEYRQPLDLLKLSFPITSPAFFRRFGFTWIETVPGLPHVFWGHGSVLGRDAFLKATENTKVMRGNSHLIRIEDCKNANFDVKRLAANLGISL